MSQENNDYKTSSTWAKQTLSPQQDKLDKLQKLPIIGKSFDKMDSFHSKSKKRKKKVKKVDDSIHLYIGSDSKFAPLV
jgi:cell fate (sporulation/competence/biofilm development) regulator YmcA (YheA/YmcA/DUF963 family)